MNTNALERVDACGILPVIAVPSVEAAVPLADALVRGGVNAIEVTLRNSWALEALARIRAAHPDMAIEVGMQNAGMSQALAMDVLKSAGAAIAPTIFGVWMDFSGTLLAGWWRRKDVR